MTAIDIPISVGRYKWSQVWVGYIEEESEASPVPVVIKLFLERGFPSQEGDKNQITGRSQILSEAWSYTRMKRLQGRQSWTRSRCNHIFTTGREIPWSLGVYKVNLLSVLEYSINSQSTVQVMSTRPGRCSLRSRNGVGARPKLRFLFRQHP